MGKTDQEKVAEAVVKLGEEMEAFVKAVLKLGKGLQDISEKMKEKL